MKRGKINLLIVFCIILIIFTIVLFVVKSRQVIFLKPEFDASAEKGKYEVEENFEISSLKVNEGYNIFLASKLVMNDVHNIPIYFKSDDNNSVYVKLRIYTTNNEIIYESGLLKPGEYIKTIKTENINESTDIVIKVMSYDMNTYYSQGVANLKSKIEVGM